MTYEQEFRQIAGEELVDTDRTLVNVGDRRIWARHYKDNHGETTLFCIHFDSGAAALSLMVKTQPDGSEELKIGTGLIDNKFKNIDLFTWSSKGKTRESGSTVGADSRAEEGYKPLADKGFPKYNSKNELPFKVDIEAAVNYWLKRINDCMANSQELTNMDLSVRNTVGQFKIG